MPKEFMHRSLRGHLSGSAPRARVLAQARSEPAGRPVRFASAIERYPLVRGGLGRMDGTSGGGASTSGAAEPSDRQAWRARTLAQSLIPTPSRRWRHSQTAAQAAAEAGQALDPQESAVLVSAAWLHDIGYHHPDPPSGFHPLDGAALVTTDGWPLRVAALVAHHSQARFMAAARGLLPQLAHYPCEDSPVTDALIYADMTSAPDGGRVTLRERLADVRRRHAGEPPMRATARKLREPHLVLAVARVDLALLRAGLHAHPALPLPPRSGLPVDAPAALAATHPQRPAADLEAALHAAVSLHQPTTTGQWALVAQQANALLLATSPAGTDHVLDRQQGGGGVEPVTLPR